ALLENLTVHGNGRVGIACFSSNPRIVNCIVSSNTGPGIHSQNGTPPAIAYSDIWNNNPNYSGTTQGPGSISQNPNYVNAALGDFRLQSNSVCVNTGDPAAQYNDPDGTRNDMGAFSRTAALAAFNVVDTNNGLRLSWSTIQTNKVEGILILRSTNAPVTGKPQNGKQYQIGNELGNALVIFTQSGGNQSGETLDTMIEKLAKYHYSAWGIYTGSRYSDSPLTQVITTTAVEERKELSALPQKYDLHQNYPNPFTPATVIAFDLPRTSTIALKIYDLHGHLVRTLLQASRPAGRYELTWDGKDERNRPAASGIYFIRMQAGPFQKSLKATRLN
ncbi:MAG: FlgD immunoglobulin-like domain containing protein, partial [candidate division KSB1 bacterium]